VDGISSGRDEIRTRLGKCFQLATAGPGDLQLSDQKLSLVVGVGDPHKNSTVAGRTSRQNKQLREEV
jgi:hypothetical protein